MFKKQKETTWSFHYMHPGNFKFNMLHCGTQHIHKQTTATKNPPFYDLDGEST